MTLFDREEPPQDGTFGQILAWMMQHGVRPHDSLEQGSKWQRKRFAEAVGRSARQVGNWLNGSSMPLPDDIDSIERAFFGTDQRYKREWRLLLRKSLGVTRSGEAQDSVAKPEPVPPVLRANTDILGAWKEHHRRLKLLIHNPLPGSTLSLASVYIPLRARYVETWSRLPAFLRREVIRLGKLDKAHEVDERREDQLFNVVADLERHLSEWLEGLEQPFDALRILRGGPGSGKSSFAKHFVAHVLASVDAGAVGSRWPRNVLLVPLQHLDDEGTGLIEAVGRYLTRQEGFPHSPIRDLEAVTPQSRLLIVFDGLDELGRVGPAAARRASGFLTMLRTWLETANAAGVRVASVVIGRDAAVQRSFGALQLAPHQVLQLMPYVIEDPSALFAVPHSDQRSDWWTKWATANGLGEERFPQALATEALRELSIEPLTLYIIASTKAYNAEVRMRKDRTAIFGLVLNRVVSNWHNRASVATIDFQPDEQVVGLLEIVAAAAWTDGGRLTSGARVLEFCANDASLKEEFKGLIEERDLAQVVVAFYLKYNSYTDEVGIEFTHKSFCDYLAARFLSSRWKRAFVESSRPLDERYGRWRSAFAGGRVTGEISEFIHGEVRNWSRTLQEKSRIACLELIEHIADRSLLRFRNASLEDYEDERSALEAVFVLLAAVTGETEQVQIKWKQTNSAAALLAYMANYQGGGWHWRHEFTSLVPDEYVIFVRYLARMEFAEQSFVDFRMVGMNLSFSGFSGCDLRQARFTDCVLLGVRFSGANLQGAHFHGSNVSGALFDRADLRGANLEFANGIVDGQLDAAYLDHTTILPANYKIDRT